MTEEHKRKIGEANSISQLGHKQSQETINKRIRRGREHYNWQGGISYYRDTIKISLKYKQWRKAIFERDEYTCVICGQVGGKLNAHHIKSFKRYPELRFEVNNGITMCVRCHRIGKKKTPLFFL